MNLCSKQFSNQQWTKFPESLKGCLATCNNDSKVVFYWDQPFLVGWVSCFIFGVLVGKTVFGWFGWSTVSTSLKPGWNGWKSICLIILRDCSSHNDYSQELPRFNQKRLKSVLLRRVNRINPNRLRLERLIPIEHDPSRHDRFPCVRDCSCGILIGHEVSEAPRVVERRYSYFHSHSVVDLKSILDRRHKVFPLK